MEHRVITPDPLMSLAHDILLRGPREAVGYMHDEQVKEWRAAAQWYVDTDGDDPDLQFLCDCRDSQEDYGAWAYAFEVRSGRDAPDFQDWAEANGRVG